jgi:NAD(P)-dependent dehydrogenase (short-subunit alcohol dehydrogenase family)
MVKPQQARLRIVVVGTEGQLGQRLAAYYSEKAGDVVQIALAGDRNLESIAAELGEKSLDLVIFADDYEPPDHDANAVERPGLWAGLERLAYVPVRLASLMRPALAVNGGGKLVLLSRTSAIMEHRDGRGRYLERPFRAAAHMIWRCLSIEWHKNDIQCIVVALDDPADAVVISRLPETIAAAQAERQGTMLIDGFGKPLPW